MPFPDAREVTYTKEAGRFSQAYVLPMIEVAQARIAWNDNDDGKIQGVFVDTLTEEWTSSSRHFRKSGGACFGAWNNSDKFLGAGDSEAVRDFNGDAIGTFGLFLAHGFESPEFYRRALVEFARVDECEWARRLLIALDFINHPDRFVAD